MFCNHRRVHFNFSTCTKIPFIFFTAGSPLSVSVKPGGGADLNPGGGADDLNPGGGADDLNPGGGADFGPFTGDLFFMGDTGGILKPSLSSLTVSFVSLCALSSAYKET